ncbi:helix-turn-helix domain-containing protein [Candidatus Reidiella endopervernicosa]|uniref:DNA binding HTH domain-containing protein n=1 Tax=Candidatus Reidiella endopervernicosa TaxID=2738883 RepID=A0A6N0HYD5_9GAMM|nr:helix-turn-helix domain-containing protein [Candidatus Reidiella endopervernicosa]QKQ27353.1 hypothetical protein HUE57_14495 [Candidatus Reidiella endopervernicosa]
MKSIQQTIEERRATQRQNTAVADHHHESSALRIDGRLPTLEEAENLLVAEAMQQAGNNQGIAASLLGISRSALNRRLNRHLQHLISSNN